MVHKEDIAQESGDSGAIGADREGRRWQSPCHPVPGGAKSYQHETIPDNG